MKQPQFTRRGFMSAALSALISPALAQTQADQLLFQQNADNAILQMEAYIKTFYSTYVGNKVRNDLWRDVQYYSNNLDRATDTERQQTIDYAYFLDTINGYSQNENTQWSRQDRLEAGLCTIKTTENLLAIHGPQHSGLLSQQMSNSLRALRSYRMELERTFGTPSASVCRAAHYRLNR